jgi:hypothetical protein
MDVMKVLLRENFAQKGKGPLDREIERPFNLILAVTYVPTQLPVQYHRPCEA